MRKIMVTLELSISATMRDRIDYLVITVEYPTYPRFLKFRIYIYAWSEMEMKAEAD